MRKNITKILLSSVLFFIFHGIAQSQNTNPSEFFPLNVGNIWVYKCVAFGYGSCNCIKLIRIKTTDSLMMNDKTYFVFQKTESIIFPICGLCGGGIIPFDTLRIDSVNYNIYEHSVQGCSYSPNEKMIDSLNAGLHDTIKSNCGNENYICIDTNSYNIFGMLRPSRLHFIGYLEGFSGKRYIKGIGLYSFVLLSLMCRDSSTLVGCVINGIVYGDTSFPLGVTRIGTEIPEHFSLFQNYPNPFNPNTNIKFQVAKLSDVKLIIYDEMGREIETLINEELKPGIYEAEWDASNYPSGVYFYKLMTSEFTETRKMVLVK